MQQRCPELGLIYMVAQVRQVFSLMGLRKTVQLYLNRKRSSNARPT